jgi:hypothetical protein
MSTPVAVKPKRILSNIRPREVSLVDEAANLREFIVVKRKGGTSMGKKTSDILKDKNDPKLIVLKTTAEQKTAIEKSAVDALAAFGKVVETIKGLTGTELKVQETFMTDLESVMKSVEKVGLDLGLFTDESAGDGNIEEDKIFEAFANLTPEKIEKAGKKMSAERLTAFKTAFAALEKILKELDSSEANDQNTTKGGNVSKPEQTGAQGEESEVAKSLKALTEKVDGLVTKNTEISKSLETVTSENTSLKKELEEIKKSAAPSNGGGDEDEDEAKKKEEEQKKNKGKKSVFSGAF